MKTTFLALIFISLFAAETAQAASCSAELLHPRGSVLETFHAQAFGHGAACNQALKKCRLTKNHGRYRLPGLRCELVTPRVVTLSCSAHSSVRGSRAVGRVFSASATGADHANVKARACAVALEECANNTRNSMTCYADNGAIAQGRIGVAPVRVVTPPVRRVIR